MQKSKTTKTKYKQYAFCYSLLAWPLLLFCVFWVYVNISSITMAFQHYHIDGTKAWAGLDNFKNFISQVVTDGSLISTGVKNNIIWYVLSLGIGMPLNIFFAYIIFKKVPLSGFLRFSLLLPMFLSSFIYALIFRALIGEPIQKLMIDLGFANFPNLLTDTNYSLYTQLGFSLWTGFGMAMLIYPNAMNSIAPEIYESAKVDGVDNMFTELRHIILPLIYPTLSTMLIIGFVGILSNAGMLLTFFRYNAPEEVYMLGYYFTVRVFNASNYTGYPELAAGGLIMTLIMAPLSMLFKHLLDRYSPVRDAI